MSRGHTPIGDRLFVGMQHLLPQHLLSRVMHAVARSRFAPLKNLVVGSFLQLYSINLSEALQPDAYAYESFNAFFTRALKPDARPVDQAADAVVSPVDGTVSQAGRIERDMLLQAKGIHYTSSALLGGDHDLARQFDGGSFATLYLAPFNYHRIHMPLTGTLLRARHVPGDLFSVNSVTAASVPGLFARNERVACVFDTLAGPMAVVLVGALFVLLIPGEDAIALRNARFVALWTTLATFLVSLLIWIEFDSGTASFQFVEKRDWLGGAYG